MAAEQVADSLPGRLTAVARCGDETFGDARPKPDFSMHHFHSFADRLKQGFFFLRCVLERDESPFLKDILFHMLPDFLDPSIPLDDVRVLV